MSKKPYFKRIPIDQLYVNPKNPRKITNAAVVELMGNIEKDPDFLNNRPLLVNYVNKNYVIYAGMQRFEACKRLGYTEVPCFVDNNLPMDVVEHRMLLDNVHQGTWDEEKLMSNFSDDMQAIVHSMRKVNPDINLEANPKDKNKKYWFNLTFQMKEDINNFYIVVEKLLMVYPDTTVSQRLIMFMNDTLSKES